jgi:Holliday junction resolvase
VDQAVSVTGYLTLPVDRRKIGKASKVRGAQEERNVLPLLKTHLGEDFIRVGNRGASSADCESETFVVEVKSRQSATWRLLLDAWAQAEQAAQETGKEPRVLVSFVDNRRRTRWLITKLEERE